VPETEISSAGLDPRRRRALFRSRRRGLKEMDVLLGSFTNAFLAGFSDSEMDEFERLLDASDQDVLSWLTGAAPLPKAHDTPVMRKLMDFHTHAGPINL